jgi:hypothetical protein
VPSVSGTHPTPGQHFSTAVQVVVSFLHAPVSQCGIGHEVPMPEAWGAPAVAPLKQSLSTQHSAQVPVEQQRDLDGSVQSRLSQQS